MPDCFYLDSSALVKHYAPEEGSEALDNIIAQVQPKRVVVSIWSVAETVAALNRKKNVGTQAARDFLALVLRLSKEVENFWNVKADSEDIRASFPLIFKHNVNATDALHLHLALSVRQVAEQLGSGMVIVTSDQRLLKAAKAEGLITIDPEQISESELKKML